NVAENLARLGTRTRLVAAIGQDPLGERLLAETAAAGVDVALVRRTSTRTGTYTAVLDDDGELVVAVSDMGATDEITPDDVGRLAADVAGAGLLVLDGNLAPGAVAAAAELAAGHGVPVVLEPVSVPKAERLRPVLAGGYAWFAVTPNRAELGALTRMPVATGAELGAAVAVLHAQGVSHVWVRLGGDGSLLFSSGHAPVSLPAVATEVVDVTGAGDAMLGAFCHALLSGRSPTDAALLGHAAAALTVAVPQSVRPDLSADLVEALATRSAR
ncbi:MAG: PfkB family carbohydrate kinase, partial [Nocardioides sp.]